MYSWRWVRWTPETCSDFAVNKYPHTVASCWILLIHCSVYYTAIQQLLSHERMKATLPSTWTESRSIKKTAFWNVTPRSLVGIYRRFGQLCCYLYRQSISVRWRQNLPPQWQYISTSLHCVISQKCSGFVVTSMWTSHLQTQCPVYERTFHLPVYVLTVVKIWTKYWTYKWIIYFDNESQQPKARACS